jgi:hypothetical protein
MNKKEVSPIDMLFDENNKDNIVLYDDQNNEVEFEQIALIPVDEKIYAILRPLGGDEPLAEDEALVFAIEEVEDEEVLIPEENEEVVDAVFNKYYELLKEQGIDVEIVEE